MKKSKLAFLYLFLLLPISSGCKVQNENKIDSQVLKINLLPDKCGFYGVLMDNNKTPIVGEVVWLGEVIWNDAKSEGHFVIDGGRSHSTISDELGNFFFQNIETNDYVIIIGNLEENPLILPKSSNPNEAKIFNCTDGDIINVEEITIDSNN